MHKSPQTSLSFASALSHEPADKRIDILRLIGETGSISQAAREAKVSYKAAWQAIDILSNLAGVVLVERAVGGSGGGGASLTPAGQKLLALAQMLIQTRSQLFAAFSSNDLLLPPALPVLSSLGLRTSMRNHLPCRVDKLEVQGQVVRAHLRLPGSVDGTRLVARITKVSAELLGLHRGQELLALCKATGVRVTPYQATVTEANTQSLPGLVVRVRRGKKDEEVSLQLDAGLLLVGFAATGSGLKVKSRVSAWVKESAVVIALSS